MPFPLFAAAEKRGDMMPLDDVFEEMLMVKNMLSVLQLVGRQVLSRTRRLFLNGRRMDRMVTGTKDVIAPTTPRITWPHGTIPRIHRIARSLAPTSAVLTNSLPATRVSCFERCRKLLASSFTFLHLFYRTIC